MVWSWIIWIALVVGVLAVGFAYLNKRLIGTTILSREKKRIARIALAVLFAAFFLSMFLYRAVDRWGVVWAWFVYVGLGLLSLLLTGVAARDIVLLVAWGFRSGLSLAKRRRHPSLNPSRRNFLVHTSNLALVGLAAPLTSYGVWQARRAPRIVEIPLRLRNLPEAFEGFRIVQVTDVHAGLTVRRDWIETIARQVDDLKPDLIALTGDLVDGEVPALRDDVAPLADLTAPFGKFFVTGNHEYYSGARPWVDEVDRMGYRVLLNEHVLVRRNGSAIVLAGVTDSTAETFVKEHATDPAKAIAGAPGGTVKILLAHQPRSLYQALPLGFDLQLSGHTHGGQFIPWNFFASLGQPYIAGLHRRDNTWVYVSRGTGYWGPPVRLGARSEVTVITLTREPPGAPGVP